jgi:tetratricopeptide (TPR) repeat protein
VSIFWPATRNGFVDWDDPQFVVLNPFIRGLSLDHLRWMFTSVFPGTYHPLAWISLALDHAVWGLDPRGYHLTSVALHGVNAALFAAVAARLLAAAWSLPDEDPRPRWWGGAAALLFALHPLRVEVVAWVSDRRDLLCALFFLLSVKLYLPSGETARPAARLAASWLAFAAALLSKGSAVALPLVLLVLELWPLRRLPADPRRWSGQAARAAWLRLLPFFAAAVPAGLVGAAAVGAYADAPYHFSSAQRLALGAHRFLYYLAKTAWPAGLAPGCPTPFHPDPLAPAYWGGALLIAAVTAALVRWRRPWALAAWASYAALIAPLLGLTRFSPQVTAERYTYLALLPAALAAAAGLAAVAGDGRSRARVGAAAFLLFAATATLSVLTRLQVSYWKGPEALWTRAVRAQPESSFARENLGEIYFRQARYKEAFEQFKIGLKLRPDYAPLHYGLAQTYAAVGAPALAERFYSNAIRLDPAYSRAYNDLGMLQFSLKRRKEAAETLRRGLEKTTDSVPGEGSAARAALFTNLGNVLLGSGDAKGALAAYREAIRRQPDDARSQYDAGLALRRLGRDSEAVPYFERALLLAPRFTQARVSLEEARRRRRPAARSRAAGSRARP